jgi:hypothetical protein
MPPEVALAEARQDRILDDLGQSIGQHAFEAAADLDPDLALAGRDNQDHAIVQLLGANAPMTAELIAEILDGVALQRGKRDHHDLIGALVLERLEVGGDRHLLGIGEQVRVIDDAAGQLREIRLGVSGREPWQQRQGQHQSADAPPSGHLAPRLNAEARISPPARSRCLLLR